MLEARENFSSKAESHGHSLVCLPEHSHHGLTGRETTAEQGQFPRKRLLEPEAQENLEDLRSVVEVKGQTAKLAQSLSALFRPGTDEKRWVDGVLARKKGLGL